MKRHLIFFLLMIQTIVVFSGDTDYLHTSGNRILDAQGREVWITGVNWFGYETSQLVFYCRTLQ
jgi:hypothetical protein